MTVKIVDEIMHFFIGILDQRSGRLTLPPSEQCPKWLFGINMNRESEDTCLFYGKIKTFEKEERGCCCPNTYMTSPFIYIYLP